MSRDLRIGDWVMHEDQIAVITAIEPPGAVIHHVENDGTTREQRSGHRWDVAVPLAQLRLATEDEIPASRRYPGREEEERLSAERFAASPPPVPADVPSP